MQEIMPAVEGPPNDMEVCSGKQEHPVADEGPGPRAMKGEGPMAPEPIGEQNRYGGWEQEMNVIQNEASGQATMAREGQGEPRAVSGESHGRSGFTNQGTGAETCGCQKEDTPDIRGNMYSYGMPQDPPGPDAGPGGGRANHQMSGGSSPYGAFPGQQGMPYGHPSPSNGPNFTGHGAPNMGYGQPQMNPYAPNMGHGQSRMNPYDPNFGPQFRGPDAAFADYGQPQGHGYVQNDYHQGCGRGTAFGPGHPKHDAHQYGQIMKLVGDMATGNADPSRVMEVLGSVDAQFWKGALVGVGAALLLTSSPAQNAISNVLSGIFGIFGKVNAEEKSE
jgi:hypothetical protein